MFHRIGLISNPDKEETVRMAERASDYLRKHGADFLLINSGKPFASGEPDLIITFGGDGTFLIGARYSMKYNIPLLGINMGTVGFLTEEEPDHLYTALDALLRNEYRTEERMMLDIENMQNGQHLCALNDAVVTRGGYARLIRVECRVNGERFGLFTADGMIAATPTGSTGYSLSAGGPIVEPEMQCIVLTPVCAHSLQKCPLIVSANADIRFRLFPERKQTAELQIDGMNMGMLDAGDEIKVTGSTRSIRLLRLHPYHFYTLLHTKLKEWGSNHE